MKKFCPKCGKDVSRGTFCNECDLPTLEFKQIKLKLCPSGKYFFKGKWKSFSSLKEVTEKVVEKSLSKKVEVIHSLDDFEGLLDKTGLKKEIDVLVVVDEEEFELPLSVEITSSPDYSKVGTDYFEGILQVRNVDLNKKKLVSSLIKKEGAYVNKVVEKGQGVDFYFVKKKLIGRIAEKIVDIFGGVADYNAQLFSQDRQSSKELFRLNVAVHIPLFKKGDVILVGGDLIFVKSTGKQITGVDLVREKNIFFKYDNNKEQEYVVLKKYKTKVLTTHPLSVLSNETYELIDLKNPLGLVVKKDQDVAVVEHAGRAYLIK